MAMVDATPETSAKPVVSGLSGVGVVLEGVSWETYERLLEGIGNGHTRVTYDNGLMEIEMSPSRKHESDADFLRTLVTLVCYETGTEAALGGATTHKRKDLAKGLEPDGCYWIANEKKIRGVAKLDLAKHPPPDLAIEVDLTSRSVSKIAIYAAIGITELWHVTDKGELIFLHLDATTGKYQPIDSSISLPWIKRAMVEAAMNRVGAESEIAVLKQLVDELGL